jgi:hypothetical protein
MPEDSKLVQLREKPTNSSDHQYERTDASNDHTNLATRGVTATLNITPKVVT